MQKLLISRKVKEESQELLEKLQPEKYGKGAYCDLSYTPSKLADHILFREASYLKKIQEEASRNREIEAQNKKLGDQIEYLKKEKAGIENSLNKMIAMYKEIMSDMEAKNEQRIKKMQIKFKEDLQKLLKDKEEEARYVQSEKEILQERIKELEDIIEQQKEELRRLNRNKSEVQKDLDQLTLEHKHLNQKFKQLGKRFEEKTQQAQEEYKRLKEDFMNAEIEWKDKTRTELHKKDLQSQKFERTHKAEIQKVENQRKSQLMIKNQEIKDLTKTFQGQTDKLRQILEYKQKAIDTLSVQNHQEKTRVHALTRQYEAEINHLSHEKNRLLDELDLYAKDNEALLKDKALLSDDLQKENVKLRDLLYESSVELQKCKGQMVGLARDNTRLLTRVKSSEEEAKTWRDSYYISKTRPA